MTLGTVAFCTLAGFAFAKLQFRGRNLLLGSASRTMMVPMQMGVIPLYMMMARLGLTGHLPAVILPTLVTAFGVFFMRQYIVQAVPDELLDAAYVDGANTLRIFLHVVVPAVRPAMAVLAHAHVPHGLERLLLADHRAQLAEPHRPGGLPEPGDRLRAAAVDHHGRHALRHLPVLIVFAFLGKHIVGGIMQGAVKG